MSVPATGDGAGDATPVPGTPEKSLVNLFDSRSRCSRRTPRALDVLGQLDVHLDGAVEHRAVLDHHPG
ncbi:MAG TPA: hypothetical protein VGF31_00490, partial [Myxococcaceae bacterium]